MATGVLLAGGGVGVWLAAGAGVRLAAGAGEGAAGDDVQLAAGARGGRAASGRRWAGCETGLREVESKSVGYGG
jgi:hypothetical protein